MPDAGQDGNSQRPERAHPASFVGGDRARTDAPEQHQHQDGPDPSARPCGPAATARGTKVGSGHGRAAAFGVGLPLPEPLSPCHAALQGGDAACLSDRRRRDRRLLPSRSRHRIRSAQGREQQGLREGSWDRGPMLNVTGTLDGGAKGQDWRWKVEPYDFAPPGGEYLALLTGADHYLGRRPSRPVAGSRPNRSRSTFSTLISGRTWAPRPGSQACPTGLANVAVCSSANKTRRIAAVFRRACRSARVRMLKGAGKLWSCEDALSSALLHSSKVRLRMWECSRGR